MKAMFLAACCLWLSLSAAALGAPGQYSDAASAADHTPPSYDMKGQALLDLAAVQQKFVSLANAIPADKLTWRPSPDARSFAEVFLHVAGERYQILALGGATPPAGFVDKGFDKSSTDRTQIIVQLNKSWDFAQKTINGMTNADFA